MRLLGEVTVIVQDLAEEYGLEPVEVSRAIAAVAEAVIRGRSA